MMTADKKTSGEQEQRDERYIAAWEDIARAIHQAAATYLAKDGEPEFQSQRLRFRQLERAVASERRLLEELSLPCRLILEHFSTFLDQPDRSLSVRCGQCHYANGAYLGFSVNEWGHVTLNVGNFSITWRDADYQYMFYADKVILRAYDLQKPEIAISFNFSLKYSKLLEAFRGVREDSKTVYYQPDLFDPL
ncbi:MAG: hypothetical protein LBK98_10225 [Peptococcaceae bacterium]|jgi:hypothetical protein|nr:hypothetical protein [Peptococcaceae bacterium]